MWNRYFLIRKSDFCHAIKLAYLSSNFQNEDNSKISQIPRNIEITGDGNFSKYLWYLNFKGTDCSLLIKTHLYDFKLHIFLSTH